VLIGSGDGASVPFDAADIFYVNASATRPVVAGTIEMAVA